MSFREYKNLVATSISHKHSVRPAGISNSCSTWTEKTLKTVVNGCAWSLRDSQGSLLNQSWQILTTSPEVQRVLNYRPCDRRHEHGRLPDHFSAFSLQFPQSLCRTLAKQFLVKDSWHSALGILEQLHSDDDVQPFDPSASSWENRAGLDATSSEMDIDRNVDMPSSEPPVIDASPTVSERKEITNWLHQIHQQIGHRDIRTLARLLKQRGTLPWVLMMAHDHRCSACEESKPLALRHITSSYENVPGAILEIDGMHWQHPVTGRHARCQFMVDVG